MPGGFGQPGQKICLFVPWSYCLCVAPRNIYQSSMGKQAIAVRALDFEDNMDTKTHVLNYPHKPLVSTWTSDELGLSEEPAGQVAVVAIACFTGYNQEDSIIVNEASLQRGMFRSTFHRVIRDSEITHGSDVERFEKIDDDILGKRKGDYSKLGADGIVDINTHLEKNDVVIGKTIEFTTVKKQVDADNEYTSQVMKRDRSAQVKTSEPLFGSARSARQKWVTSSA